MNKLILFLLTIAFLNLPSFSQHIKIEITNSNSVKAALFSLSGESSIFIDSIFTFVPGKFIYENKNLKVGFYRFTVDNQKMLIFIYDGLDVELSADSDNISESTKVINSESNKLYFEFIKLNKAYKTKTELLQLILFRYPKDDDYYWTTKNKLVQLQEEYLNFVNVTAQTNPKSFVARYVRTALLPIVDTEIPFEKQLVYLKSHALDNVNFYDADLIYSDAFTNKTIEYLTYFRNPQLPLELLEKEFMSAIDSILNKAKVNNIVYQHIAEYLLDGFKKFGFDNVLNYIVENYVIKDDLCLDQKLTTALDKRIEQNKRFKVGATVPNIVMPDLSGSTVDLNKIQSEKTLIIFYASWCPHCQTLLPQIYDIYKNQKERKFDVMAISIDTSKADWQNFVKLHGLNDWINVCDLKGWYGKTTEDYLIYATPTMFLIDKGKRLIKIPKTLEEIYN